MNLKQLEPLFGLTLVTTLDEVYVRICSRLLIHHDRRTAPRQSRDSVRAKHFYEKCVYIEKIDITEK